MTKYTHAKQAIEKAVEAGTVDGLTRSDILLALIVSSISAYRETEGNGAAREAVLYELGELDGTVDTQFIRSR